MPRTVWFFWDTGMDVTGAAEQAIESRDWLFERTLTSWRLHNPSWEIRILNFTTLPRYMNASKLKSTMSIQAQSDVIRINVLNNHGGVWADATLACLRPLDAWIWPFIRSVGYFMYGDVCSWFIASAPRSALLTRWVAAADAYWATRDVPSGNVGGTGDYRWLDGCLQGLLTLDRPFRDAFLTRDSKPCIGPCSPHMFYQVGCRDQVPVPLSGCVQECIDSDDLPDVAKLSMHAQCGFRGLSSEATDSNGYHILERAIGPGQMSPATGGREGTLGGPERPTHYPQGNRTCIANSTCFDAPPYATCSAVGPLSNAALSVVITSTVMLMLLMSGLWCWWQDQERQAPGLESTPYEASPAPAGKRTESTPLKG